MRIAKGINLKRIKTLMLVSQLLLLLFTGQWLYSQYNGEREQLKQNLVRIFTGLQQRITDSLLLTHVIDPAAINKNAVAEAPPLAHADGRKPVSLSAEGLHRVLTGASSITSTEEKKLFRMDTIVFNEMFTSELQQNGLNFSSRWISNDESGMKGKAAIFIPSSFFTDANGVIISNYHWYLLWRLLPQILFVLVLLVLTAAAFRVTFRSLDTQLKLAAMKDDFISNMSHELKTPIATVKVALEALNSFNLINDPQLSREYLGMAAIEMDRLELLATRVLNTSLLESGKIYLQQETYDLKRLVEETMQCMQPRFQNAGATINFRVSGEEFFIRMDKLHMQGVLVNLLDNSLKYGLAPVSVDIQLTENKSAVQLAVTDNGPGIPEEYKEKVFEKFFRIPAGNLHNTKGHGLGLSYAAQVMRQHNGSIGVNNVTGGGCVFTLTF